MENLFAMMFEDVTHESSLIILLSPSEIEENIDLTNQYRIEILKDQISIREADSRN